METPPNNINNLFVLLSKSQITAEQLHVCRLCIITHLVLGAVWSCREVLVSSSPAIRHLFSHRFMGSARNHFAQQPAYF